MLISTTFPRDCSRLETTRSKANPVASPQIYVSACSYLTSVKVLHIVDAKRCLSNLQKPLMRLIFNRVGVNSWTGFWLRLKNLFDTLTGNEHLKLALPHFWYKPSV